MIIKDTDEAVFDIIFRLNLTWLILQKDKTCTSDERLLN